MLSIDYTDGDSVRSVNRDSSPIIPSAIEQACWQQGIATYDARNYELAAIHFRKLAGLARPQYNTAISYLKLSDQDSAVLALEKAITLDPFLCIAHYQLAFIHQLSGRYDRAIKSYEAALEAMRGNSSIDYSQLGLKFTVFAFELFTNLAAAQMDMCDPGGAMRSLITAHQHRTRQEHDILESILIAPMEKWDLFPSPRDLIFRPKHHRRSFSLALLNLARRLDELPSSRELVDLMHGELDKCLQFAAPVQQDSMIEELTRLQLLDGNGGEGGTSLAASYTISSSCSSSSSGDGYEFAKVHLVEEGSNCISQTRMICVRDCLTFEELLCKVQAKFSRTRVKLKYRDHEGDMITMCDQSDYLLAKEDADASGRLCLWCFPITD